jgi:copper chaperone CopZ
MSMKLLLSPSTASAMLIGVALIVPSLSAGAEEKPTEPQTAKFRVLGLFLPERETDFKETLKQIPEVALTSVDYATAEATFQFDAAKAFPGAKPEQIVERLDERVRNASRSTFGIRALSGIPRDKQKLIEIPVVGLDCKACSLAAYEAINRLEGVEQATASFKAGLVTAWIVPEKIDQGAIEAALKARGVTLKQP